MSKIKLEVILKNFDSNKIETMKNKNIQEYDDVKSFTTMEITLEKEAFTTYNIDNGNLLYIISELPLEIKFDAADVTPISTGKVCFIESVDGFTQFYIKNLDTENNNQISINIIEY